MKQHINVGLHHKQRYGKKMLSKFRSFELRGMKWGEGTPQSAHESFDTGPRN